MQLMRRQAACCNSSLTHGYAARERTDLRFLNSEASTTTSLLILESNQDFKTLSASDREHLSNKKGMTAWRFHNGRAPL